MGLPNWVTGYLAQAAVTIVSCTIGVILGHRATSRHRWPR